MINKNNIQKIRISLGMSRKDFAAALGVTSGAISNYEYGVRLPRNPITFGYDLIDLAKPRKIKLRLEDIYPRDD